jgi:hypothetical protein
MAGDGEPPRLASADLHGGGLQAVELAQHAHRLGIEQHALGRRLQPSARALEQGKAHHLLELGDLRADRGLGHTHGAGRGGHRAVVDDGTERFQEAHVH